MNFDGSNISSIMSQPITPDLSYLGDLDPQKVHWNLTPEELMEQHTATDLEAVFLKITGRRIAEGS